jgi:hypothetical protein
MTVVLVLPSASVVVVSPVLGSVTVWLTPPASSIVVLAMLGSITEYEASTKEPYELESEENS